MIAGKPGQRELNYLLCLELHTGKEIKNDLPCKDVFFPSDCIRS